MSRDNLIIAENSTLQKRLTEIAEWKKAELAKIEKMEKTWTEFQATFDERKRKAIDEVEAQAAKSTEAAKAELKAIYDRVGAKLGTKRGPVAALEEALIVKQKELATKAERETRKELAGASFKPVKQDADEVKRLAAYRAAQLAAKIEEDKKRAEQIAAEKAALAAEYERNTVAKRNVEAKRNLEKREKEEQHLANLKSVRQERKPTLFYSSFIGKSDTVWAVNKDKADAKKAVTRKEKIAAEKERQAHRDVQADFDAIQLKSVNGHLAPNRISMWQPKRFSNVADATTQTAGVDHHVDPNASTFRR